MSVSSAATTPTPSDNAPAETVVSLSGDVLRPFSISADIFPAPIFSRRRGMLKDWQVSLHGCWTFDRFSHTMPHCELESPRAHRHERS